MSMDRCTDCDTLIDTDYAPEVYREEFNDECLCEACWIERCEERDVIKKEQE